MVKSVIIMGYTYYYNHGLHLLIACLYSDEDSLFFGSGLTKATGVTGMILQWCQCRIRDYKVHVWRTPSGHRLFCVAQFMIVCRM